MKKFLPILFLSLLVISCTETESKLEVSLNTDQLITDLQVISSDEMEGRLVGTEGNAKARAYIISRFEEMGVPTIGDNYAHSFSFKKRDGSEVEGNNILAMIEGDLDTMIVISAHYDHLGIRDSLIYNGADDDASGTAAVLAVADYFTKVKPRHTLVFATFDAEEGGLRGARAFVEDSVFLKKVKLNVNMDMIAQNDKNELYAVGTYHSPSLKTIIEKVETGDISLLFGHDSPDLGYDDWTMSSDHGPFHQKGIPFVYFGVEDHEHYHKATDEFETIPQDFYKKSVQVILDTILELDKY